MTQVSAPRGTRPAGNAVTHSFTELAQASRTLGLQSRTRWFYALVFTALIVALGGAATGLILLDDS